MGRGVGFTTSPDFSPSGDRFRCNFCDSGFVSSSGLWKHKNTVHFQKRNHVCSFCGKVFLDKAKYADHVNSHKKIQAHLCPHCPSRFTHRPSLCYHIRSKHRPKMIVPSGF
ncbi:hypothetical protein ACOMHN_059019 [Nucella lapillus]